jgi:hypothetical protein
VGHPVGGGPGGGGGGGGPGEDARTLDVVMRLLVFFDTTCMLVLLCYHVARNPRD